jgi:hypothetical protein
MQCRDHRWVGRVSDESGDAKKTEKSGKNAYRDPCTGEALSAKGFRPLVGRGAAIYEEKLAASAVAVAD